MDLELTGKRALVLASSQGLGGGIAAALAAEGAHVVISGRSEAKLAAAAKAMTEKGPGRADYVVCDLSAPNAAKNLYDAAMDKLGGIDILVNNTGGPPPGTATQPTPDQWRAQFETMVLSVMEITNLCLPGMRERKWGRVLTVASSGVVQPIPTLAMSNTLRSALVGWSKTLSIEVGADNVTVNMLLPGRIHTERVDQLDEAAAKRQDKPIEDVRAASRATIPMGRYGTVEEFAATAAFLVSGPASYVTGTLVRCDGGATKGI